MRLVKNRKNVFLHSIVAFLARDCPKRESIWTIIVLYVFTLVTYFNHNWQVTLRKRPARLFGMMTMIDQSVFSLPVIFWQLLKYRSLPHQA